MNSSLWSSNLNVAFTYKDSGGEPCNFENSGRGGTLQLYKHAFTTCTNQVGGRINLYIADGVPVIVAHLQIIKKLFVTQVSAMRTRKGNQTRKRGEKISASPWRDSNSRPLVYETSALTSELQRHCLCWSSTCKYLMQQSLRAYYRSWEGVHKKGYLSPDPFAYFLVK